MRIQTELGRGTSVKVYVPKAPSGSLLTQERHEDVSALAVAGRPRILLVDDDNNVREVTKTILEEAGYIVSEAGSGGSAIEQLEKSPQAFAAAVIDFAMPA